MRSFHELAFRVLGELKNAYSCANPPELKSRQKCEPALQLPDPGSVAAALVGTDFARQVIELATTIRNHRFPLFGGHLETGPEIRWRRDYSRNIETDLRYFRRMRYLDVRKTGDHKVIWELNRHNHLVVLAQAYLLTRDAANLSEIQAQLESWFVQNPYCRGINWTSALEVAFRALSWTWVYYFVGSNLPAEFRERWMQQLYRHGAYLQNNLSLYFSPNTHLIGESLALHALGLFFSGAPCASGWEKAGGKLMQDQLVRQVGKDGSHFEHSTYYHVYALDMFLLHAVLARSGGGYLETIARMAEYLHAVTGPARELPFLGDDDGGRLFHPYGPRELFPRATLGTASLLCGRPEWLVDNKELAIQAAWWIGPAVLTQSPHAGNWRSKLFADAGLAIMTDGETQAIVETAGFGSGSAGHSHADVLSLVVRQAEREILIDPGTYTYVGDASWRDWFRGTSAHNTITVDGLNQATAAGVFRWTHPPQAEILCWKTDATRDLLQAECRFAGFTHSRRIEFCKPHLLLIEDEVTGPPGEHVVEQFWHLGSPEARSNVIPEGVADLQEGWRSRVFGEKHRIPVLHVSRRCQLPVRFRTRIDLRSAGHSRPNP